MSLSEEGILIQACLSLVMDLAVWKEEMQAKMPGLSQAQRTKLQS